MIQLELSNMLVEIEGIDDCNVNVYKIEGGSKKELSSKEFHDLSKDDKEKLVIAIRDL